MSKIKIKFIGEPPKDENRYFNRLNSTIADSCKLQELLLPDELDLLERDIYIEQPN